MASDRCVKVTSTPTRSRRYPRTSVTWTTLTVCRTGRGLPDCLRADRSTSPRTGGIYRLSGRLLSRKPPLSAAERRFRAVSWDVRRLPVPTAQAKTTKPVCEVVFCVCQHLPNVNAGVPAFGTASGKPETVASLGWGRLRPLSHRD